MRKDFDLGAWDVGNFRFKGRQISQMPNGEIVFDMEQYKHELEQIEVSKADKTKPERILNSKEHTQFRGGVGSLGWFVDHCCPQLSFQLAELRRKQSTDSSSLLRLNKVIRTAKVIESKIKIRSVPVEHLRFMGVHDAAHANLVTAGPSDPCSTCKYYELSCTCVCTELAEQEDQEGCPQQFGCRDMQYVDLPGTSRIGCARCREQMTSSDFVLEKYEQFLTARASILVTDYKSLYDAIHKERAVPASTDKRSAIELAIVKKAVSGETDLRWIRCEISNCRLIDDACLKKVRGSPTENSAGGTVENYGRRGHAGPMQMRTRDP